jgi:hypothetical protein
MFRAGTLKVHWKAFPSKRICQIPLLYFLTGRIDVQMDDEHLATILQMDFLEEDSDLNDDTDFLVRLQQGYDDYREV